MTNEQLDRVMTALGFTRWCEQVPIPHEVMWSLGDAGVDKRVRCAYVSPPGDESFLPFAIDASRFWHECGRQDLDYDEPWRIRLSMVVERREVVVERDNCTWQVFS